MKKEQNQVRQFMVCAQQETPSTPVVPVESTRKLRINLIAEELQEFAEACGYRLYLEDDSKGEGAPALRLSPTGHKPDLEAAYDAIIDLLVVVIGSGVAFGLDIDPGWQAVHASNMAKFGPGGRRREDGKWLKPPDWKAPDLKSLIEKMQLGLPKP